MGKIQDAAAALAAVEQEIDDLRQKRRELQLQAIRLDADGSPGAIRERESVLEAMRRLDSQIPANRYPRGADRPQLAWKLEQARQALDDARRGRHNAAAELAELEQEAATWADVLDELEQTYQFQFETFNTRGYPPGLDDRTMRGRLAWVREKRRRIGLIPVLRDRLTAYGEDPLGPWHEPGQLSAFDVARQRESWDLLQQFNLIDQSLRDIAIAREG